MMLTLAYVTLKLADAVVSGRVFPPQPQRLPDVHTWNGLAVSAAPFPDVHTRGGESFPSAASRRARLIKYLSPCRVTGSLQSWRRRRRRLVRSGPGGSSGRRQMSGSESCRHADIPSSQMSSSSRRRRFLSPARLVWSVHAALVLIRRTPCGHKPPQMSKDANATREVEMNVRRPARGGGVIRGGADPKEPSDCIKS